MDDNELRGRLERIERCIMNLQTMLLNLSQALAEKEYGPDAVRKAVASYSTEQLEMFAREPHPYDAMMQHVKSKATH